MLFIQYNWIHWIKLLFSGSFSEEGKGYFLQNIQGLVDDGQGKGIQIIHNYLFIVTQIQYAWTN